MTTSRRLRFAPVLLAGLLAAGPAHAQPIESDSQDALELPGAQQYRGRFPDAPAYRRPYAYGAVSPDLPASVPQQRGPGFPPPYGGYGQNGYGGPAYGEERSGYPGRDGYGSADGTGQTYGGAAFGGNTAEFGAGSPAFVAPFGAGPGGQTPIPLGAGSLYSGSAVNGTAVGPQFSNQLPAYQGRSHR